MIQMSPEIEIEAMRLARKLVKDTLVAHGYKVSAFSARDMRGFARAVLEDRPEQFIPIAWNICKMRYETLKA